MKFLLFVKVSLEVFHCSPPPLKGGIIATAMFRRFMEFSMYSQRCIIAGTLVACSVCVLIPVCPPICQGGGNGASSKRSEKPKVGTGVSEAGSKVGTGGSKVGV